MKTRDRASDTHGEGAMHPDLDEELSVMVFKLKKTRMDMGYAEIWERPEGEGGKKMGTEGTIHRKRK